MSENAPQGRPALGSVALSHFRPRTPRRVAAVIDVYVLGILPLSVVAPFAGLTIVFTLALSTTGAIVEREVMGPAEYQGAALIVLGVTAVSVFGPHSSHVVSGAEIMADFSKPLFALFASICDTSHRLPPGRLSIALPSGPPPSRAATDANAGTPARAPQASPRLEGGRSSSSSLASPTAAAAACHLSSRRSYRLTPPPSAVRCNRRVTASSSSAHSAAVCCGPSLLFLEGQSSWRLPRTRRVSAM